MRINTVYFELKEIRITKISFQYPCPNIKIDFFYFILYSIYKGMAEPTKDKIKKANDPWQTKQRIDDE
jgi:hypothetical protein